jgi:uncharacterized protein
MQKMSTLCCRAVLTVLFLLPAAASAADVTAAPWRAKVLSFAAEHFKQPAWGYSHSERDYNLARKLAAEDNVTLDDDVLFAAAYLHDIAAFAPWEKPDKDHADVAVEVVPAVLRDAGFPMEKLARVQSAIRTHMFSRDPADPEALYLHDADALDWLGAIGVARIFALVDPNGGDPDGPAVVKMLTDNLKDVPGRVLSPAGKAMMPERRDALKAFLDSLAKQTDGYRTL